MLPAFCMKSCLRCVRPSGPSPTGTAPGQCLGIPAVWLACARSAAVGVAHGGHRSGPFPAGIRRRISVTWLGLAWTGRRADMAGRSRRTRRSQRLIAMPRFIAHLTASATLSLLQRTRKELKSMAFPAMPRTLGRSIREPVCPDRPGALAREALGRKPSLRLHGGADRLSDRSRRVRFG
jgi:hypothetical protein